MLKFLNAVCKTAVASHVSINLTKKQSQDVQHQLLHHHIKFLPRQMKSVWKNEANSFALCWHCDSQAWSRYKMVEVISAYKHGRYEKNWLNSLHVMSNVKVFAIRDCKLASHPDGRTQLITLIYVILIRIKKSIYQALFTLQSAFWLFLSCFLISK